jgi:hypothetical protein
MEQQETNSGIDAAIVALRALGWTLDEPKRAERLLALTGLTPGELRGRLGDIELLAAVLRFLEAHEPDLLACAADLELAPADLVEARRRLEA